MSDKPKPKLRVVGKEPIENETPEDPKPVNADVIQAFEQLLEQAKQGTIIGFAAALQMPDEYMSIDWVGESVSYQTVGALEDLKLGIIEEMREANEE